ncbi:MAG: hypothetical protein LBS50_03185 [Prevotellaceae bacterium]|jgi:hypothetical protein|nr:hypothetical protein [Prevotellaceae bacterium]
MFLKPTLVDFKSVQADNQYVKVKNLGKTIGKISTGIDAAFIVGDVLINSNISASHILDAAITGATFIPVVGGLIGIGYLVANLVTQGITGNSIGDHLGNAVSRPIVD